ncbi:hypothetical protein GN244_ATG19611 [Phytophthora infestans]|uniref:Uncharacterized protein n=1 Tax=Phytophthora infestans TaxID=4787 RepID=A0A833W3Z2_PHYIN|nr:hypothetical protein GN244_ATG19611 [Phytophthora infestans]
MKVLFGRKAGLRLKQGPLLHLNSSAASEATSSPTPAAPEVAPPAAAVPETTSSTPIESVESSSPVLPWLLQPSLLRELGVQRRLLRKTMTKVPQAVVPQHERKPAEGVWTEH